MKNPKWTNNFEEACHMSNIGPAIPDLSGFSEKLQRKMIALYKLEVISEVNNAIENGGEKWEANYADTNEAKFLALFDIVKDEKAPRGFRLVCDDYAYVRGATASGARPPLKTPELTEFMGKECPELYADLM